MISYLYVINYQVIPCITMQQPEKKLLRPVSIKLRGSTKEAIQRICQKENRTMSFVIERAVRKELKLEK